MARLARRATADPFQRVRMAGLRLAGVQSGVRYDGAPVLKRGGAFMAAMATHPSAEPGTLVVRSDLEFREALLEDAPDTYYVTEYYQRYPLVLVRLAEINDDALEDLLTMSWRLTAAKMAVRRRTPRRGDH